VETKINLWQEWQNQLGMLGVTNPLINFEPNTFGQIDLDRAHPGGLAQFVGGGATVLSNLMRDPLAYSRAASASRRIKAKAELLEQHYGIASMHLVGGLVNFAADGFDLSEPIFLWPLRIVSKGDDFEFSLAGAARVNPALIESLANCYGIKLNPAELLNRLDKNSDLIPIAVLEYLSQLTAQKANLDLQRMLVVGNFSTVPTELLADFQRNDNPLLLQLADEQEHYMVSDTIEGATEAPTPISMDVALVADADQTQQHIVARAAAGQSFAVETLPGCGYTQTVVNILGALVSQGKQVLVVAPRRLTLNEISDRLAHLGLNGLGIRSTATWLDIVAAISRNEKAKPSALAEARERLTSVSDDLNRYFDALNRSDEELGVSISQVLEELSALSAMPHAPVTKARISRDKLALNADRTAGLLLLQSAFDLGEFKFGPQDSAWYQARFDSPEAVAAAVDLAIRLRDESLPKLKEQLAEFIAAAKFKPAESVSDWGGYLRLFSGIRETLDRFVPDVYDRPLDELIAATGQRRERGNLSGGTRRRLKKLAKEYLRPGMSVSDMNSALRAIEEQRQQWSRFCLISSPPHVQPGINEALVAYQGFMQDLDELQSHLDANSEERPLAALNLADLEAKLVSLSTDTAALENLGDRSLLSAQLQELGLGKLVRDLGRLHVAKDHLASEFDLAWWQSALEVLSSNDNVLLGYSSEQIAALEQRFRQGDAQLVIQAAAELNFDLNQRWITALAQYPAETAAFRSLLKTGSADYVSASKVAPNIFAVIAPVFMMSPFEVATKVPSDHVFDTVLVLDAAGTTTAENFSALRRAKQVIAFGDEAIANPVGFEIECRPKSLGRGFSVNSIYQDVREHFDSEVLRRSYRTSGQILGSLINREFYQNRIIFEPTAEQFLGNSNFHIEFVTEGNRANNPVEGANESLDAEVRKTVDLIFNHALWHPEESLLVSSASAMHADRLRNAVHVGLKNNPNLRQFFEVHGHERFEVTPLAELAHRTADRVIFSIGFGKTQQGGRLTNFGQLSEPDGRRALANLLVSARHSITVVTCFDSSAIAEENLQGGSAYLKDLLDAKAAQVTSTEVVENDPMLRDLSLRLRKLGVRVDSQFGDRLPLAISFAKSAAVIEPDWALLGSSLRERLRLRPYLLGAMGWQYIRVHSFELFADPQAMAQKIAQSVGIQVAKRPQVLFDESDRAFEDTDLAWGEKSDSNDDRLRQDKPPHWG